MITHLNLKNLHRSPRLNKFVQLWELLTFALQKSSTRPFLPKNDRTTLSLGEKRPVRWFFAIAILIGLLMTPRLGFAVSDTGSESIPIGTNAGNKLNVGSGKFILDGNTSNVGIGSTVPAAKLDVNGSVKIWTGAGTDSNATSAGELYVEGDLEVDGSIYGNGANISISSGGWTDGGTNVNLVTNGDNVAIGTTAFASNAKLTVAGNGSSTGINTQFQTNAGAAKITILDNGNVGLGSTLPQQVLDLGSGKIIGDGSLLTSLPNQGWTDGGTNVYATTNGDNVAIGTTGFASNGKLTIAGNGSSTGINTQWQTNVGTPIVTILDNGNIGIGSTLPQQALDLGSGKIIGDAEFLTNVTFDGWTDGGTNVYMNFITNNVGIGTSVLPSAKLTIAGNGSSTGINTQFQAKGATAKITILDNGNIGLGSTLPAVLLDVTSGVVKIWTGTGTDNNATSAGELYVQGDLEVDGSIYGNGANISNVDGAGWADGGTNVYMTANGDNIAIGTTSFASNAKLTVQGNGTSTNIMTQFRDSSANAKITILDNGNVGIGSTLPGTLFDVTNGVVKIWTGAGTDNNATSAGELYVEGDLEVDGSIYGNGANITNISAGGWTDGGTNVNLSTNGDNVAIGTTLFASNAKLTVAGNGSSTNIMAQFQASGGTAKVTILDNGNVGIGTTNLGGMFTIQGAGTTTGLNFQTKNSSATALVTAQDSGNVGIGSSVPTGKLIVQGAGSSTGITLQTQNSSATALMTALDNGNVGIGSTVPAQLLDIGGSAGNMTFSHATGPHKIITAGTTDLALSPGGNVGINTTNVTGKLTIQGTGTTTAINFQTKDSSATALVTGLDNGNVGIGSTVPAFKLDINGGIQATGSSDSYLNSSSGNVGIGSTVPAQKLDVNGTVQMTGFKLTTSPTNGYVLVSDSNGVGSWSVPSAGGGWTDGGTNVYVTANGDNVAIGTTSFSSGKLTIAGNGSSTAINTQWQTNAGSAKITILDNGNIGIGSTLPQQALDMGTNKIIADGSLLTNLSAGGWIDGGTNVYVSTNGDNVAIGTTLFASNAKLTVAGNGSSTNIMAQFRDSSANAKITILDNGNVGIGSTLPGTLLDVTSGVVKIWTGAGTDNNATSAGELYVEGDLEVDGSIYGNGANITNISAGGWTDGGTNVNLATNGDNVAIGTTLFASSAKLTVAGNGSSTNIMAQFQASGGTAKVTILDNGNVGIGTTNLGGMFTIQGAGTTTGLNLQTRNSSGTNLITAQDSGNVGIGSSVPQGKLIVQGAGTTTGITLQTQDSSAAALVTGLDNGNVGIGSTVPAQLLDIGGSAGNMTFSHATGPHKIITAGTTDLALSPGGNVGINTTNVTGKLTIQGTGTTTAINFQTKDSTATALVTGLDNGNVGIGSTVPAAKLDVNGTIQSSGSSDSYLNSTGGNLGIGSTTPSQKLDVNGTVQMTGFKLTTSPTNTYVLTSDSNGVGTWAAPGGGGWSDGGTNIFEITNSDNMGIGTSILASNAKLTIAGNGSSTNIMTQFRDSSASAKVTFLDNGNIGIGSTLPQQVLDLGSGKIIGDGSLLTGLSLAANGWTDGGTNVYVTTNGDNLGIGTTSFATNAKLTVQGNGTSTNIMSQFRDSSANAKVTILDNGNVGIGSSNPGSLLDISTTANNIVFQVSQLDGGASSQPAVVLLGDDTTDTAFQISLSADTVKRFSMLTTGEMSWGSGSATRDTRLYRSATSTFTLDDNAGGAGNLTVTGPTNLATVSGNAGIGTTSLSARLTIQGTGTTTAPNFQTKNSSATALVTMQDSGNVGISSSAPQGKLIVQGAGSTTGITLQTQNSSGTALVTALDNGNVGIGSTVPAQVLDVNGEIRVVTLAAAAATTVCRDASNNLSTCSSSREFKDDIQYLDEKQTTDILDQIKNSKMASFYFKTDHPQMKRYGIIAEEAPQALRYIDEHGHPNLDFYSAQLGYTWEGIQALTRWIETLESTVYSKQKSRPAIYDNGDSGSALTINWKNRRNQKVKLTDNCALTFAAPDGADRLLLQLVQDSTGSRTVSWPQTVKWPGGNIPRLATPPTTGTDIISCFYDGIDYLCRNSGF